MFARVKKSGNYQYLQIVENHKEKGKVKQQVIATIGRMDQLQEKHRVETLIRSLSRFSEQALLILSGKSEVSADARKIGPPLIFERLWLQTGIKAALHSLFHNGPAPLDGFRLRSLLQPLAKGLYPRGRPRAEPASFIPRDVLFRGRTRESKRRNALLTAMQQGLD
jgi:hypothetical protein